MDEVDAKNLSEAERLLDLKSFLFHQRKTSYRELEGRYGIKTTAVTRAKNKLMDIFDVPFENEQGRNGYIKVGDDWRPPMYALTVIQRNSLERVIYGEYTNDDVEILKNDTERFWIVTSGSKIKFLGFTFLDSKRLPVVICIFFLCKWI